MDKTQAQLIAKRYLIEMERESGLELESNSGLKLELNPDIVEEYDFGFVFFYNSKAYWDTRDFIHAVAGNGPLLVRRNNGCIVELPSNQSVERSLAELFGGAVPK